MSFAVSHLALFVSDLRAAESFYGHLFGMELLFRETEGENDHWWTLPPDKGWEEAEAAGVSIDMVALHREGFTLPLFQGNPQQGTVLEIGVAMPIETIEEIRSRFTEDVTVLAHEYGDLYFVDPFGYRWHAVPAGEPFESNGVGAGRWLQI